MTKKTADSLNKQDGKEEKRPSLLINAQYIKDLSFENPKPFEFLGSAMENAKTEINADVACEERSKNRAEVSLRLVLRLQNKEETVYLLDLHYAGIFTLENFSDELVPFVLYVECPRLLFPFARHTIAQLTQDSGFPPIFLDPIDFSDLLQQRLAAQQEEPAGTTSEKPATT